MPWVGTWIGLLAATSMAAAPPTVARKGGPLATAVRNARSPRSPPTHPPPDPNVKLALDAPTTRDRWSVRVTNDGDVPVRIVADARLLTLDVTPRSARQSVHCELPTTMRPEDPLERAIVLPPKRTFVETFEPRLYCFGRRGFDALASGAIVVGHLGSSGPGTGFSEVTPIDGIEPEIASIRMLDAPPIALPDERSIPRSIPRPAGDDPLGTPKLRLESSDAIDAASPEDVEIPITLHNEGTIAVTLRFRPEMLGFEVAAPTADHRCTWPTLPSAPLRELFTTIAPHSAAHLTVVLGAYCADHTLDRSGLLLVRAWLDTRGAGGASLGLRTFEGRLMGTSPTVVRLQRGIAPQPLVRPRLQSY
jgi:hypothetical protein